MLENYEEFGNLKVYDLMSMYKGSKVVLKQTPEFLSVLESLGYSICEKDTGIIKIEKEYHNKHFQSCVIYDYSRVLFTSNNIELLKLIYTFIAINPPNTINDIDVTYANYYKGNFQSLYINKKEFITLLDSQGYFIDEEDGVMYIYKYNKKSPCLGTVSENHCFNMYIHDIQLLLLLFQYSLTPISER